MEALPDIPNRPVPDKKDRRRISAEAIMAGEQKYTDIKCPVLAIFADPHDMSGPPMHEKQKSSGCRARRRIHRGPGESMGADGADCKGNSNPEREPLCLQVQ
jgi:hypothetical protein